MRLVYLVVMAILASANAFAMGRALPAPLDGYVRLDAEGESALHEVSLYRWASHRSAAITDGSLLVDLVDFSQRFEEFQVDGKRLRFSSAAAGTCVLCFSGAVPGAAAVTFDGALEFKVQKRIKDTLRIALGANPEKGRIPWVHLNPEAFSRERAPRDSFIATGLYHYLVIEINESTPDKLVIMGYADAETVTPERIEYLRQ
ncbi:MAG: hypothetical protein NDJ90_11505 [Oligoflexia bacterium]|nr:hypothetical protein [Oligoflexia bacterium]